MFFGSSGAKVARVSSRIFFVSIICGTYYGAYKGVLIVALESYYTYNS